MMKRELPSGPSTRAEKPRAALLAALKECSRSRNLTRGKQLHQHAIQTGLFHHKFVVNSLINMYAKCGSMPEARQVFDTFADHRDVFPWTALISGYVENGEGEVALQLFDQSMKNCAPDARVYVAALSACAALAGRRDGEVDRRRKQSVRWLEKGRSIHAQAVSDRCSDVFLQCKLVDMYSKCGSMSDARGVFDCMASPDVMTWNALLQGYVDNEDFELALNLFDVVHAPNSRTYTAALSACAGAAAKAADDPTGITIWLEKGKVIHRRAVASGCASIYVESAAVDMYVKCGCLEVARDVFDKMVKRDVVAWTALIMGYVEGGENEAALELVSTMVSSGVRADSTTFAAALVACGNLMALEAGQAFHADIQSSGLERDVVVANCLVDFYGKCGNMESAKEVFDSIQRKTIVSWTALMSGYSVKGDTDRVFEVFEAMKEHGVRPNEVTFVCLLTACSHAGLTDRGKEYFSVMTSGYGVSPGLKHFNCVIDLLGRAGHVEEALKLVRSLPFPPNVVTWTSLLAACRKWNNVEIGKVAYDALAGKDASAYVLMADTLKCLKTRTLWTDETGKVHKFD